MSAKDRTPAGAWRNRLPAFLLIPLLALAMMTSTASAADDLAQLLSGKLLPLSLKLKDLDGEWRRVLISGGGSVSGNIEVNVNGSTQGSTSQNNILGPEGGDLAYVTKGQTVSANGQTYLVAYRLPNPAMDLRTLLQAAATKTLPESLVLTPESSLALSLLNVQAVSRIEDVRAFDANGEIAQSQEAAKKLAGLIKAMETKPPKPPESGNPPKPPIK